MQTIKIDNKDPIKYAFIRLNDSYSGLDYYVVVDRLVNLKDGELCYDINSRLVREWHGYGHEKPCVKIVATINHRVEDLPYICLFNREESFPFDHDESYRRNTFLEDKKIESIELECEEGFEKPVIHNKETNTIIPVSVTYEQQATVK